MKGIGPCIRVKLKLASSRSFLRKSTNSVMMADANSVEACHGLVVAVPVRQQTFLLVKSFRTFCDYEQLQLSGLMLHDGLFITVCMCDSCVAIQKVCGATSSQPASVVSAFDHQ